MLTPTLALTSLAGATPPGWKVRYWDENLLQGPPPLEPLPQVVGITVHLTFARGPTSWRPGSAPAAAVVVMGGLHVLSCPDEVAPHADAIALGDGVPLGREILRDIEAGTLRAALPGRLPATTADDPPPRSLDPAALGLPDRRRLIATRGCHNRCGFCYLATGDTAHPVPDAHARAGGRRVRRHRRSPTACSSTTTSAPNRRYLRALCQALRAARARSGAPRSPWTSPTIPSLVREMALAGCTGVFIGFEILTDDNLRAAGKRSPRAEDYARRVRAASTATASR